MKKITLHGKNKYLDRMMDDWQFRIFWTTIFGGGWNFVYSIFNFVLAGIYRSYWFVTLGVYYFLLGCMRAALVAHGKSQKDRRKPETLVRHIGIAIMFVSVCFIGTVVLSILEDHAKSFNTIVMITMAAYTFYLLTMAIINSVKARKSGDIKVVALRNVSLCGMAFSMFSLERSMLASFTEDAADFIFNMEVATGAGIFVVIMALGINLIVLSHKKQ